MKSNLETMLLYRTREFFICRLESGHYMAGWRIYPWAPHYTVLKEGTWQDCVNRIKKAKVW